MAFLLGYTSSVLLVISMKKTSERYRWPRKWKRFLVRNVVDDDDDDDDTVVFDDDDTDDDDDDDDEDDALRSE